MKNDEKLDFLINDAEQQVAADIHAGRHNSSAVRSGPHWFRKVLPLLLLLLAWNIFTYTNPPQPDSVATQAILTELLMQAHQQIASNLANSDALPPALPNAALASVVDYRVTGNSYSLRAELNGVKVEMDMHGNLKTSGAIR